MILRYGEKMWLEQKKSSLFSRMQATLESSQCSSPFQNMVFALLPFSLGSHTAANSIFVQWWQQKNPFRCTNMGGTAAFCWGPYKKPWIGLLHPSEWLSGFSIGKKTCWEKNILAGSLIWKMLSNICFPKLQREAN